MIKEELEMVLNNKEAAKICADAAKMKLALQIKQAVECGNDVEVMCRTWELFTTLVVASANLDPDKVMVLLMELTLGLAEEVKRARQMAFDNGIADKLGLNARR